MKEMMIGLAEAALELRVPYQDAHRLLLTGRITGEKRGSRWFVRLSDVNKVKAELSHPRRSSSEGAGK